MTEIWLHIGLPHCGTGQVQAFFDAKRDRLKAEGVLYPFTPGRRNHTRLFLSMSDPDHIDPLRWHRGYAPAQAQDRLREDLASKLRREIETHRPDRVILSAEQLGASLWRGSELARLRDFLAEFGRPARIVAHIGEQARTLALHYGEQVLEGRLAPLSRELDLAAGLAGERTGDQTGDKTAIGRWRTAALQDWQGCEPMLNAMPEIQAPPFWLDYRALADSWEQVFGPGSVRFRPFDRAVFASPGLAGEIAAAFDLPGNIGKADPAPPAEAPSAATLARARAMNRLFDKALRAGRIIPRQLWRRMQGQLGWPCAPIDPGSLAEISRHFAADNAALAKAHPALERALTPPDPAPAWQEPDPGGGFRATQYFTVFLPMIDKATQEERSRKRDAIAALAQRHRATGTGTVTGTGAGPGPQAVNGHQNGRAADAPSPLLPPLARANYIKLQSGRFAPHNALGRLDETAAAPPYPVVEHRPPPKGSSGKVIVACMKNEGPYIVEWVAYHRAIGVDNFIIYTNGCDDGTSEILDRLQEMGIVQHRNNDNWKGNSPQQYALNQSLKEPLVKNADWIIHIDVDEFINVRCGNGTLDDFLEHVPGATNIAMTWRLFGHGGVLRLDDRPVIEQFDRCAPKYCPKPHTVWGFKTMFRNIGAYGKISCHRPNKLVEDKRDQVLWVNGSGEPMGDAVKEKGWRSELKSIGYDLLQLNHYALRSAESYLIKRQRGRALHVDRTIGLNYWIRMDWSDNTDRTIQRNLDRLAVEMGALLADDRLAALHAQAVAWHRAKAEELHANPEFEDLFQQAQGLTLSDMDRVAYALALDMES